MNVTAQSADRVILISCALVAVALLLNSCPSQSGPSSIDSDGALTKTKQLLLQCDSLEYLREYDSSLIRYESALLLAGKTGQCADSLASAVLLRKGICYFDKYDLAKADSCWRESLRVEGRMKQDSSVQRADVLERLGGLCTRLNRLDDARIYLEHALAIREYASGKGSLETATCVNKLADRLKKLGNLDSAKSLRRHVLELLEREQANRGDDNTSLLDWLVSQNSLLHRDSAALFFATQKLDKLAARYGANSPQAVYARKERCSTLQNVWKDSSTVREMLNLCRLLERLPGNGQTLRAEMLTQAGTLLSRNLCEFVQAESVLACAVIAWEPYLHQQPLLATQALVNLGALYEELAQFGKARACLTRADSLLAAEVNYPTNQLALLLNWRGNLERDLGNLAEAESLYQRSMETRIFCAGPEASIIAEACNNLGETCLELHKYSLAEQYFNRAIFVREKEYGSDFAYLTHHLVGLSNVYNATNRHSAALEVVERAAKICHKAYATEHLHWAWIHECRGDSYTGLGRFRDAARAYTRAMRILLGVFTDSHPDVTSLRHKLALLHGATGDWSNCHSDYQLLIDSRLVFLREVLAYLPEEQRAAYSRDSQGIVHSLVSVAILQHSRAFKMLAMEMLLKGKAALLDASAAQLRNAHCSLDSAVTNTVALFQQACARFSEITIRSWKADNPAMFRDTLASLRRKKSELETKLSSCSEFDDELKSRNVSVSQLADRLSPGAGLVEIVRFAPHDVERQGRSESSSEQAHYAALTLDRTSEIGIADLGPASAIDSLILIVRNTLSDQTMLRGRYHREQLDHQLRAALRSLYQLIWKPIAQSFGHCSHIIVSPDGTLSLLPLEILLGPNNKFLIEDHSFSYVASGRDLLIDKDPVEHHGSALLMADPDYFTPREDAEDFIPETLIAACSEDDSRRAFLRGTGSSLSQLFVPLPHTREEVTSIGSVIRASKKCSVTEVLGRQATEEYVKAIRGPRILHLATHGFFFGNSARAGNPAIDEALVESGLALAYANSRVAAFGGDRVSDDGLLTALEIAGLDLRGTDLVFLSACETGVGAVMNGEGVLGMRRAFQIAGSRSLILSLWKVPDKETQQFSIDFYSSWLHGMSKVDAIRSAALKQLAAHRDREGWSNPLAWGGFVLSGNYK